MNVFRRMFSIMKSFLSLSLPFPTTEENVSESHTIAFSYNVHKVKLKCI